MTFTPQDSKLLVHIIGLEKIPTEIHEIKNNDEDRKMCVYQHWNEIRDFVLYLGNIIAKILNMYIDKVQKEFLLVKSST